MHKADRNVVRQSWLVQKHISRTGLNLSGHQQQQQQQLKPSQTETLISARLLLESATPQTPAASQLTIRQVSSCTPVCTLLLLSPSSSYSSSSNRDGSPATSCGTRVNRWGQRQFHRHKIFVSKSSERSVVTNGKLHGP